MKPYEPTAPIVVCIHVAEPLLQAGVRATLETEAGIRVVEKSAGRIPAGVDVLVVDGPAAFGLAEGESPGEYGSAPVRVLALARSATLDAVRCALQEGVHGVVLCTSPLPELAAGVRALARGDNYLCLSLSRQMTLTPAPEVLTRRENEVLGLLARGACNKTIARGLDIAVGTVKWHVRSIMMKLEASTRTQAASIAMARGLVDLRAA